MLEHKEFSSVAGEIRELVVWLALILICITSISAERLPVKTYTVADGLLRDSVSKIRQDSHGYLWFCTAEGVSRFDGVGMMNFTIADGLPDRSVEDFLETSRKEIYIATGKGLARLNPDGIRNQDNSLFTVFLPDNKLAEKILTLYEDKKGQIWVGTSDGLYKLIETGDSVTFEIVSLGEPLKLGRVETKTLYITAVLADRSGTIWVGTNGSGLFRLSPDGNVRRFTTADGFGDNKITALLETRDGRMWMSMRSDEKGGVCLLDTANAEHPVKKCYTTKDGIGSNWIRGMLETTDGQIWMATVPGLCKWQGEDSPSVCKTYTKKSDLCGDIFALMEDKDGNLWTGSSCGAKKIARYGFTTYNETDGLNSAHVNSVFENSNSELFAISFPKNDRIISRFDGEKFSPVKVSLPKYIDYHGWGWQQTVWQDNKKVWWIPTAYGLFRSPDNTSFENLATAELEKQVTGAKEDEIFRLFEDSLGNIWIATTEDSNELLRWNRGTNTWHDYTLKVGFSPYRIGTAFTEDLSGNIWIGASSDQNESALIRWRNGEFHVFTEAEGAPSGWIRDLYLDSRGSLWIASTGSGLWRLDDTNSENFAFTKYTVAEGLTSSAVASVTEDAFGRIYVGTWRGIDRLNPDTGQIENFTTADGLPASFVEISFRDSQNNLWFGTDEGLVRFIPEPLRVRQPPAILITGLRVEGERQNISILGETSIPKLDLKAEQRQIAVDFLGLGATLGEKLKYEYRFGNSDWTQTNERTVNFANLSSGDYHFEVRAKTADGIYSQQFALVSFRIAAPIWQKWWFIAALLALTALVFYWFYRFRLSRLLEVANMRTRIATDLHDDIGANLTKIAILSEVAQQQLGHKFGTDSLNGKDNLLGSVADTSRESVSSMGDIVWAINPKKDSLIDLSRRMRQYAKEILERRDIDLDFDAPTTDLKLDANIRRNIYLIFKESVNNIVRHSNATAVIINLRFSDNELILKISDDGNGFDTTLEYDTNGLLSIKKRAKDCGGQLEVDSIKGTGTNIVLRLKLKSAAWSWR